MKLFVRRDHLTIAEALAAAEPGDTIIIPSGIYKEKLIIDKSNITLIGDGMVTITYDAASGRPDENGGIYDTFSSATVTVTESAEKFTAENITFENSYNRISPDREVTQAVALSCAASGAVFDNCNILGRQDTLYLHGNTKQFFHECYIEGSVDFIFGDAAALFEDCDIVCVRERSYITAADTAESSEDGFVFYHCYISANEGCRGCFLGRPWRAEQPGISSATAFIECTYDLDIDPAGWLPWHLEPSTECDNTRYCEYGNIDTHGHAADTDGRVPWSRTLSRGEAEAIMLRIGRIAVYFNKEDVHNHG